jgi:hypothetical protein
MLVRAHGAHQSDILMVEISISSRNNRNQNAGNRRTSKKGASIGPLRSAWQSFDLSGFPQQVIQMAQFFDTLR